MMSKTQPDKLSGSMKIIIKRKKLPEKTSSIVQFNMKTNTIIIALFYLYGKSI